MEMRAGYKRTDAGIIPEDWKVNTLGEIGDVRMCKRVLKQQTRSNGDVPFYKIGTFGGVADAYINHSLFEEFKRRYSYPKKGDVLISAAGTIGRSVIFDGSPSYFQDSNIVWIENDESKATNEYLWHRYQVTKWAVSHGGTVARLYNDSLRTKIHIPLPTLSEQRAISQALSDVDALIATLDRLVAKKRDIKQATMQQLLTGKTRLPGFGGEWKRKKVASFTNCVAGGTPSTLVGAYWGGTIKWMSSGDLHLKRVADVTGRITQAGLENSAATILPINCVLIGLAGQGKTRGTVAINLTELSTNQSIGAIIPNDSFVPEYLFYNLDSRYTELRELSSGGGRGGLNLKLLGSLDIPLPCLAEQKEIASVLADMDAELSALEARRDKTRAIKQGMMQELLTGKTRLI